MGNTPSHTTSPPSSSSNVTQSATAPRPIPTSSAQSGGTSSASHANTFHSGLTPPAAPPSPPPPSTPTLLPFAGHLSPQNPHCLSHPQAHDYSKSIVTRLILDGKLAPFYRGLEDFEEEWTEEDVGRILTELRESDYTEGVANSFTERLKEERDTGSSTVGSMAKKIKMNRAKELKREEEKEERERREKKAYLKSLECPICFLNYPPNINTSRCCQQPVCTECFVQIKRSEATITHLESEPACCPFCMETDFGVIYERPPVDLSSLSESALSTSVASDVGDSGFSQALSLGSEAELSVGPGMAPKAQETARRKSVSHHAPEVVTIDEIRPDWESKLNAVKAAAARRASRRIVMRQVGDRLIPIGYTSSRATGTADFSMSIPQASGNSTPTSGEGRSSRRRESNRERDLEELMIMEAMRLSMVDHEEHQKKIADERRGSGGGPPSTDSPTFIAGPSNNGPVILSGPDPASGSGTASPGGRSFDPPASFSNRRASAASENTRQSGTSKLLSKINNVRARASSSASQRSVSFAPAPSPNRNTGGGGGGGSRSASISSTSGVIPTTIPTTPSSPLQTTTNSGSPISITTSITRNAPQGGLGISPTASSPLAPIVTPASPTSQHSQHSQGQGQGQGDNGGIGLPRLSLDMAPMTPSNHGPPPSRSSGSNDNISTTTGGRPTTLERLDSGISEATVMPSYAQLDSDEE